MKNNLYRRARERKEMRVRILDAARELFVTEGAESVTLRQVARAIEYSATAIYQYFPDKQSLITELCTVDFAGYSRVLHQAERVSDPVDRLRKVSLAYLEFAWKYPHHYRTIFLRAPSAAVVPSLEPVGTSSAQSTPEGLPPLPAAYGFLYSATFKALAAGCLKPELLDAHLVTQSLWSGLHGVASLQLICSSHPQVPWRPLEQRVQATIDCLLHGILHEVA